MEQTYHSLLRRQLRRTLPEGAEIDPVFARFLVEVDRAYRQADDDRELLERSLSLCSVEIVDANREHHNAISLLSATLESTADGILVVDQAGKIAQFNQKFIDLWRIPKEILDTREDKLALSFAAEQLIDPEAFLRGVSELYVRPDAESQGELFFKDGRVFERYSRPQIIHGKTAGRVWSFRDVTERHVAEENLRESQALYRDLVESANDIIFSLDLHGNVISLNQAGVDITGFDPAAGPINVKDLVEPAQRRSILRRLREVRLGRQIPAYEMTVIARDGRRVSLEVLSRLRTPNGRPPTIHGVARDITERRQLEHQLRQSQKMEAVGQLAGGVAHDFNNMLTAINGFSQLLLADPKVSEDHRAYLQQILTAGTHAATLTQQLLALSRRQIMRPTVVDLNKVLADLERMLGRLIREDISLELHLMPGLDAVYADVTQLQQVIINLIVNARDAIHGVGKITVETSVVELDETCIAKHPGLRPGRHVRLAITDTGIGMDKATMARVFEPFFTTKEVGNGTGLGLSTAYGIVQQSDGVIDVYSEQGKGSTFRIYLPSATAKPAQSAAADNFGILRDGDGTILVLEDEDVVRMMVTSVLTRAGYRVIEASIGSEALAKASALPQTIDLVVSDLVLPEMSGPETVQRLVAFHPEAKVLFMSGYADRAVISHSMVESGSAFLSKPFSPIALLDKVKELLSED